MKDGPLEWTKPRQGQAYLDRKYINNETRIWNNFVAHNLIPTSHLSDVPKETALLIYLLMKNEPVRLEDVIYRSILKVPEKSNTKLVFPHLISDLYLRAGVQQFESDELFRPLGPFQYTDIAQNRAARGRTKRADPRPMADIQDEGTSSAAPRLTLHKRLANIELEQARQGQLLTQIARHLGLNIPGAIPEPGAEEPAEALEEESEEEAEADSEDTESTDSSIREMLGEEEEEEDQQTEDDDDD